MEQTWENPGPGLVCRVHAQDHTLIFTWKNKYKIELEDHAKLSAYWPRPHSCTTPHNQPFIYVVTLETKEFYKRILLNL